MKKRIGLVNLLAVVVLFGTAGLGAAQIERQMGGIGITVFQDRNFRGRTLTFQRDIPDLRSYSMDRRISSLRIGPGEQWEVCASPNFRGGCVVVSGEESDLRRNGWNDRIASVRRVGGGAGPTPPVAEYIVLFDRPNFRGNFSNHYGPVATLNRRAQSVTIGGGVWELCDGNHFTGRCTRFDTSSADLGRFGLRNRVASARPVSSPGGPSTSDWSIVLFDQPNFRGSQATFRGEQQSVSRNVRSVNVGGGIWEICDGNHFTGRCVTLNHNVTDLRAFNIGRRIASLRPLSRQPR
jgi:hypothetical protein